MKYYRYIALLCLMLSTALWGLDEDFHTAFDLFYNYRFDEAEAYCREKIDQKENPFPYYAFLSYIKVRSGLANAEYDIMIGEADKSIRTYRTLYEDHLSQHPEDVQVQFYYTVLLAGKMRVYLNKMEYLMIIREAPKILSNKIYIDYYSNNTFHEMDFGTGAFDYYLSVVGRNFGLGGLMANSSSDGIRDLWSAYEHAVFTRWEAAIVLMYVYLYDKTDYDRCRTLCREFLDEYPDNFEVLAIAAECAYYQGKWAEGDAYVRRITKLLDGGLLRNDTGWRARLYFLKGVRAMLKDEHVAALDNFNRVYEMNCIEYSWYQSIVLKYTGDVYLKMGLVRTAKLYYEETVNSIEIIPHVREAKDILKTLK